MGRPHIEFIDAPAIEPAQVTDGPFAGASQRLLSIDSDGRGDFTALISFPAGWSGDLSESRRPTEIFVLEGMLAVAGSLCGPGVYSFVPAERADTKVGSPAGAVALVMAEPEQALRATIFPSSIPTRCPGRALLLTARFPRALS